jgi:hypothetical protein
MAPCCSSSTNHHLARLGAPQCLSAPDTAAEPPRETPGEAKGILDSYLDLLAKRLSGSYNVVEAPRLGKSGCSLYARSHVTVGKYIFHKSVAYEKMELNEHVFIRVSDCPATPEDVEAFVADLKASVDQLVKPSYEHMSSAITGVLVGKGGFPPEAGRRLTKVAYTRHFWLGLRGWAFLRLLGVDLTSGEVFANRRGKEVLKAYTPG